MQIALFHKHYNETHLEEVKAKMLKLGAPKIRAIWSEAYGVWMAVEGCHRLRAAEALGICPIIIDVSNQKTLTVQLDEENVKVKRVEFEEEYLGDVWRSEIISFDDEQE